jgi:putative restriction endonuclease
MDDLNEFDRPLFKKLAHNDTGAAAGHQGGILIPKELDKYFPQLSGKVSEEAPTVDENIRAGLFVGDNPVGIVSTRYQYQTWGATRQPERRITSNLGPLRNVANAGDYVVIERSIADRTFYRLRLLRAGTPEFKDLGRHAGTRRWGPVSAGEQPVSEPEIAVALGHQLAHEADPLVLFDNDATFSESRTKRISRSRAFQIHVSQLYQLRCAVCEEALQSPTGLGEAEAAHIVPRHLKGADDARNGLSLCRTHHWAFDHGLFGVNHASQVHIPKSVSALPSNAHLTPFDSKPLMAPTDPRLRPAAQALDWHMNNVVNRV